VLVGDSLTGKTIASVPAPAGLAFESVSAADDDRTFVIVAATDSGRPGAHYTWFELKIAPGTAHPGTLTRVPIEDQPYEVVASAVSGLGKELAVAGLGADGKDRSIQVFSLSTGRQLNEWTTSNQLSLVPSAWPYSPAQYHLLTWVNNDITLTFTSVYPNGSEQLGPDTFKDDEETIRLLNITGTSGGDLMADSTTIWTGGSNYPAPLAAQPCGGMLPLVSPDGKTGTCVGYGGNPEQSEAFMGDLTFVTNQFVALDPTMLNAPSYSIAYETSQPAAKSDVDPVASPSWLSTESASALWASSGGGTLIVEYGSPAKPSSVHVGVVSRSVFTPLHLPTGLTAANAAQIAW
jgi:hypothetical protein